MVLSATSATRRVISSQSVVCERKPREKEPQKMGLVAVTTIKEGDMGTRFRVHEDDAVKKHYALAVNIFCQ